MKLSSRNIRGLGASLAVAVIMLTTFAVPADAVGVERSGNAAPAAVNGPINPQSVISYFKLKAGRQPYSPVILAHRGLFGKYNTSGGANRDVPENSLAAIKAASDAGIEGVEIDVRETSDPNTPVIMHDSTVGRTTNVFNPTIGGPASIPASVTSNILAAGHVNLPPTMSAERKATLTNTLTAESAFSPYGKLKLDGDGLVTGPDDTTIFGRSPLVKDLSPATLKALHLLKFKDPALRPAVNDDGSIGTLPTAADVYPETVSTVQDVLAYVAANKLRTAIVFDVLEQPSLAAIAKILAADTHTFVDGLKAKDIVVLKYRGNLAPSISYLMDTLKRDTVSAQHPQGFYPNVIGIVANYLNSTTFNALQYVRDWSAYRAAYPERPLIALDIVQTNPIWGAGAPLIQLANQNHIAIGSFNDVPSYRGGDFFPPHIVAQRLYFTSNGNCCRTPESTGDPDGTPDTRYDYSWLIPGNGPNAIPSGMITSDDPLPIIARLVALHIRDRALAWYALNSYDFADGGGIIADGVNFSIRMTVSSSRVVEPTNQGNSSGANAQVYEQVGAANSYQTWTFLYDKTRDAYRIGVAKNNNLTLTWDSSGTFSGGDKTNVIVYNQGGGVYDDQYWLVEPSGVGRSYVLRNYKDPSKLLAIPGGQYGNQVNVKVNDWGVVTIPQERWFITPIMTGINWDSAPRIRTQLNNNLVWNSRNDGLVDLLSIYDNPFQQWYFTWDEGIDAFKIRPGNLPAQLCLTYTAPPGGTRDVRTANCLQSAEQGWIIQPQWNNRGYIIRNATEPSMLLVVRNADATVGQRVILYQQANDVTQRNQLWTIG